MRPLRFLVVLVLLACALPLAVAGCSSSPKKSDKKKKRTVLVTEYDDARVGQEASKSVESQVGLLGDPSLDSYLGGLGNKLLRGMPRRGFDYQFRVVDQFEPNAFALPGGYIFISRGLLALANTEDELANVVGHEITHSARRHAAAQQALAARLNPLARGGTQAQMASYGRDMEREADQGGQILASAAGYDPMGMSTFLQDMGLMERLLHGHSRMPHFFDTHPTSSERAASNAARAREIRWTRDPSLGDTHAAHLRRIDGLPLDQRPEAGVFVGDDFLHPDMDFQIRFPRGWRTANQASQVGAVEPRGGAMIMLEAGPPVGDLEQGVEQYLKQYGEEMRLELQSTQPVKVGRFDALRSEFKAHSSGGEVAVTVVFLSYGPVTWRIVGMSLARHKDRYRGAMLAAARSFGPLGDKQRASIRTKRLRITTARAGETIGALSRRTGNAWDAGTTAVYNGIFVDKKFEGGELVKIAQVEPYRSRGGR